MHNKIAEWQSCKAAGTRGRNPESGTNPLAVQCCRQQVDLLRAEAVLALGVVEEVRCKAATL